MSQANGRFGSTAAVRERPGKRRLLARQRRDSGCHPSAIIKGGAAIPARSPFMLRPRCRTLRALSCSDPYFEPVPPRLARNTIIESTFEVGRRFSCTMRVDCGQLDPGAVIRPVSGEWHPRMPERLDEEELADWRAGRNAVYQLAALTIGARLAVGDA